MTADGYTQDTDGGIDFFIADAIVSGDDREQLVMMQSVDAIVLGAATYRMFAEYWPTVTPDDEPVAEPINRLPKHVVSNTLDRAPWGDGEAVVERGDGVESIRALKERYAGDLIVLGQPHPRGRPLRGRPRRRAPPPHRPEAPRGGPQHRTGLARADRPRAARAARSTRAARSPSSTRSRNIRPPISGAR